VSETDSTQITITLSSTDLNGIKAIEGMAKTAPNSYLRVTAGAVTDMAANSIAVISDGSAVAADSYVPDTTVPTLNTWNLNMETRVLTLNFSESVDASTLSVGGITLQDAETRAAHYTLTNSTTASGNGATIAVNLSATDRNAIIADTSLAVSEATSWITLTSGAIDDMAGNDVTAIADGSATQVTIYTVRGTVTITAPVTGTSWAVNETTRAITWTQAGDLDNVKLYYATEDDSYATWTQIDSSSTITAVSGTHTWSAIPDLLSAPQTDPNILVKIKVTGAIDTSISAVSDAFSVIYYTIVWHVRDITTLSYLSSLSVNCSSGWLVTNRTLNSPVTRYFAYDTYTTSWSRENYFEASEEDWVADSSKSIQVLMETTVTKEWLVFTKYSYDSDNDRINLNVWIEREGILMLAPTSVTMEITDSAGTLVDTLGAGETADSNGVFWMTLDTSSLSASEVYFAKTAVVYAGSTYTSGDGIALSLDKELGDLSAAQATEIITQGAFRTATSGTLTVIETATTGTIPAAITSVAGQVTVVGAKVDTVGTKIDTVTTKVNAINTNVTAILEDTSVSLPVQIRADVTETLERGVLTEILTRNTTIREDETIKIRYRTSTGLSPTLTLYNASGTAVTGYSGAAMTEIASTGIYESSLTATSAWGSGDFTVVCSETTKNSTDSMVLTVKALYVAGGGVEESIDSLGYAVTSVYSRAGSIISLLGASTDETSATTIFGKINDVEQDLSDLGLTTTANDARNAKTNASNAYSEVSGLRTQLESGVSQAQSIQKLLAHVEGLKTDLGKISSKLSVPSSGAITPGEVLPDLRQMATAGEGELVKAIMSEPAAGVTEPAEKISVPRILPTTSVAQAVKTAAIGAVPLPPAIAPAIQRIMTPAVQPVLTTAAPAVSPTAAAPEVPDTAGVARQEELRSVHNKVQELTGLVTGLKEMIESNTNKPVVKGWFESE